MLGYASLISCLVAAACASEEALNLMQTRAAYEERTPTAEYLVLHTSKLRRFASQLFGQADADRNDVLDSAEMRLSLQTAMEKGLLPNDEPGALDLAMQQSGEDRLFQFEEFVNVVRGAAEMIIARKASASNQESRDELCRVSVFATADCSDEAYGSYGLFDAMAKYQVPQPHLAKGYKVVGTRCGDVELWDDEEAGSCASDNEWWDYVPDVCRPIQEWDIQDDISGVTIYMDAGGVNGHCSGATEALSQQQPEQSEELSEQLEQQEEPEQPEQQEQSEEPEQPEQQEQSEEPEQPEQQEQSEEPEQPEQQELAELQVQ